MTEFNVFDRVRELEGECERLRAENDRLRARVAELEGQKEACKVPVKGE